MRKVLVIYRRELVGYFNTPIAYIFMLLFIGITSFFFFKFSGAFFFLHYSEMRSFHRTADNPLNRGDSVAAYINTGQALTHGLRACLALEQEPYPYDKWLWRAGLPDVHRTEVGTQCGAPGGPSGGRHAPFSRA